METHRLVVASDDQVLIPPSPDRALIERVYDPHVGHLLKPKQATFVKLHAVAAIGADADHRPDDKGYLKRDTSPLSVGRKHGAGLENTPGKVPKVNYPRLKLLKVFQREMNLSVGFPLIDKTVEPLPGGSPHIPERQDRCQVCNRERAVYFFHPSVSHPGTTPFSYVINFAWNLSSSFKTILCIISSLINFRFYLLIFYCNR